MAIRALYKQEFDRFGATRVTLDGVSHKAVEWFADDTGVVLGAMIYHEVALNWSFVILTRDSDGEFRALDFHTELHSLDEARRLLSAGMETALARPTEGDHKTMSDDLPTVNRLKAIDIVANLSGAVEELSTENRAVLENALERDLDTASHQAADDRARLEKVEGQVHALSDAIIAITAPSDAVDGAVKTVKDKM